MADFVFNIAKGRGVEFYNRVENNDPSTSALILTAWTTSGTEAQGQDIDDPAALDADANFVIASATPWPDKVLTDTELAAFPAPDDGNNRYDVSVPQVTWTAVAGSNNTNGLTVGYDSNTGSGTARDAAVVLVTHHTFTVTTDGNDVVLNSGVFLRAT